MTSILVLILCIAILGVIVWYVGTLPIHPTLLNLIYAIVCIAVLVFIINAIQSGHLPSVRL